MASTATTTQHTPTPWLPSLRTDAIIVEREHGEPQRAETTAHYGGYVVAESLTEADRAFVLRACNSHEQLVAALRAALRELGDYGRPNVRADIRAALVAAGAQ